MKTLLAIMLLLSVTAAAQDRWFNERRIIYQHIIRELVNKDASLIDETVTSLYKYDIDGNYQKWFYQPFASHRLISVVPVEYESTVLEFLSSRGIQLDTNSINKQLENSKPGCLSRYVSAAELIPFTKAPLKHSTLGNLFQSRMRDILAKVA